MAVRLEMYSDFGVFAPLGLFSLYYLIVYIFIYPEDEPGPWSALPLAAVQPQACLFARTNQTKPERMALLAQRQLKYRSGTSTRRGEARMYTPLQCARSHVYVCVSTASLESHRGRPACTFVRTALAFVPMAQCMHMHGHARAKYRL